MAIIRMLGAADPGGPPTLVAEVTFVDGSAATAAADRFAGARVMTGR